jgi:DNA-binding response OmpR family regulator/tetratricopeptide (TPR) repeat protein
MLKTEVQILIVDDDNTIGKSLTEAITRAGMKAVHVTKPDDALKFAKLQPVHIAVIDCMLPKMNGRDLAKKMRDEVKQSTGKDLPVFLMSGIYKDRTFARDALQATGALAFLTKPFDLKDFLAEINKLISPHLEAPMVRLQQFLTTANISANERIWAVDEADTVHAFDLPWIYSLLLHPKVSGHLNIISADNNVAGVSFANGEIVKVFQDDTKSYFGGLLVEHGYIAQSELDEAMKNIGASKKLGEYLVENCFISPHAVDIVMNEQQGLRLSQTISDTSVRVNFIEADDLRANVHTDASSLAELTSEWLMSKITGDWLKSYYLPWMTYNLKKGTEWTPNHRVFSVPVVTAIKDLAKLLLETETLDAAIARSGVDDEHFLRGTHALIISRVLRFDEPTVRNDYESQRNRLKKLLQTLEGQTYFERLGVSQKSKDSEFKRAYHELAKVLHPDKLPQDAPQDVRDLTRQTFEKISVAYKTLIDQAAKEKYTKELEKGSAEGQIQSESLTDEARGILSRGDVKRAREMIEQAIKLAPPTTDIKLLYMWAKLKSANADRDPLVLQGVKDEIATLPPEDRHSVNYFFVRGLVQRFSGDIEGARRDFEHCISNTPDFIDARRELSIMLNTEKNSPKSVNLLSGDLKDVVGMFFKKKK